MKRIATLTLVVSLLATAALASEGAWTPSVDEKRPDRIYVNITRGRTHNMGTTLKLATFTGLSAAQMNAATMTPVRFELRREAGNGTFEGTFRNGKGAGQFTFTPNPGYLDAVRALGVEVTKSPRRGHRAMLDGDEELFAGTFSSPSPPPRTEFPPRPSPAGTDGSPPGRRG